MIEQLTTVARTVVHPGTFLLPSLLLAVVLGPVAWVLAGRWGGIRISAAAAAMALIGVADVTVLRPGLLHAHADWSRLTTACVITDPGGLSAETVLNVALFVPFAFLTVLVFGRALPAVFGAVAVVLASSCLSLGIEATQAAYGIGACDSSDVVHNVLGAGLGAVAGLVVVGLLAVARPTIRSEPTPAAVRNG